MRLTTTELSLLIQVCDQILEGCKDEETLELFSVIKEKLVREHYTKKMKLYGRKSVKLDVEDDENYNSESD